jgi:glycerol-3-phosphate dehydrogenase subunit C
VSNREKVVYFSGCWANYYGPEIGKAFVQVMKKNGFDVLLPEQKCCGMPMMANANLKGAEKNFGFNIKSLYAAASPGYDVITTCPSCNMMLRKEGRKFFDSDEAHYLSEHLFDADEYLLRLHRQGSLNTDMGQLPLKVFYHNPCHLKVQGLTNEPLELLGLIPAIEIVGTNYYCCGLSGSYGMKKQNYTRSVEIAQRVWDEAKKSGAEAVVTECGGCGLRIQDGTGLPIFHPMMLMNRAYKAYKARKAA